MALYQRKNPETVEAYPTTAGDYMIIKSGVAVPISKAEFEGQYVPLVKQG